MTRALIAAGFLCFLTVGLRAEDQHGAVGAAELLASRSAAEASYRDKLAQLAQWCDEQRLASAARLAREWLPVRDRYKVYIFKVPGSVEAPEEIRNGGQRASEFWGRFIELRQAQADGLFELAKRADAVKDYALAFDLVRETCRENPDHAQARAILGYVRLNGGWALPDTARRLAAGQVDHEKFGWLPAEYVRRYEDGQRYYRGKWITADEDERLHSSIRSGWQIDSEHYVVTTNHSLEEGVLLSRRLEHLYDIWRHVFVDYSTPQPAMHRWFEQSEPAPSGDRSRGPRATVRPKYQVTHFRNRGEYQNTLRPLQPQIEITLGIYFSRLRTAYFFAGDQQYAGTLLHEGTHQLFQETGQRNNVAGARTNFWAIEAVACYMESLVEHEHWYTLGGMDEGRVPAARKRLLEDQFYVPLRELAGMSMLDLQRDERLPKIYSQISGQALFFLQSGEGRYRRAFVDYLTAIYTNKADGTTLAKLCGKSYEELDEEYRQFIRATNAE